MTYNDLIKALKMIPKERLEDTVTVFDPYEEEYIAVIEAQVSDYDTDVLDPGHFFLVLKA